MQFLTRIFKEQALINPAFLKLCDLSKYLNLTVVAVKKDFLSLWTNVIRPPLVGKEKYGSEIVSGKFYC